VPGEFSKTPVGEETLTLVSDGVLDGLSVGFRARKDRVDEDGTVVREKADLVEVAVVLEGAYGRGALISGVRQRSEQVCDVCGGTGMPGHPAAPNLTAARQLLAQLPPLPGA
jgi:phage head maturation protease